MSSDFFDFYLFPTAEADQLSEHLSGQNGRHILAVINEQQPSEEIITFFGKILSAVNLDIQKDVLLLQLTSAENISFSSLYRKYDIEYVLLFGAAPQQLGLHLSLPAYHPVSHAAFHFLRAHSLPEIHEERQQGGKEKAGALWKALKQIFLQPETE